MAKYLQISSEILYFEKYKKVTKTKSHSILSLIKLLCFLTHMSKIALALWKYDCRNILFTIWTQPSEAQIEGKQTQTQLWLSEIY